VSSLGTQKHEKSKKTTNHYNYSLNDYDFQHHSGYYQDFPSKAESDTQSMIRLKLTIPITYSHASSENYKPLLVVCQLYHANHIIINSLKG